jgi:hypothetical protein
MFVTNDGEGKRCAKESEQLNATTDTAKLSRGVERAAWGRGAKSEERTPRGFRGQLAAFTSGTERAKIRPEKEKLARSKSEAQPC